MQTLSLSPSLCLCPHSRVCIHVCMCVCVHACMHVCVAPCTDSCGGQGQASSTILYGSPPFMKTKSFTELLPLHHWARWEPETGESPEAPGPASLEYADANTKPCLKPEGKKTHPGVPLTSPHVP